MTLQVKNKALESPLGEEPHAFGVFRFNAKKYPASLIEEIAIGQSVGAWEESQVSPEILRVKVAKLVEFTTEGDVHTATLAFPWNLWHGKLDWLLAILFGKMSFYEGVQLADLWFSPDCFGPNRLMGPMNSPNELRRKVGASLTAPLLMGILKPNVAMTAEKISHLYLEAAQAGVHILKDDEIRHDVSEKDMLERVSLVANCAAKQKLKTLYAVHFQIQPSSFIATLKRLEEAGASALLVNVWTAGLGTLQAIRRHSQLPILAHPALVGAFGLQNNSATIHPRVTLGSFVRAGGADLSLFPSPYGKLGLPKDVALSIASHCREITPDRWPIKATTPVPSAGIKPEHAQMAIADFGEDFVLNAGTGIYVGPNSPSENIAAFRHALYEGNSE